MAALGAGAGDETARSLAEAAVAAEAEGNEATGLSHFIAYLESLEAGRIDGKAEPVVTRPALAVYLSDARGGVAHTGFDRTLDDIAKAARLFGVAVFSQKNAYPCGALGYFTGRLAARGLVAIGATNGPPLLAGSGSVKPVYCTNPISFAAPSADGVPLVIDQASSATAFVKIRKAAEEGERIPEGWAIDAGGNPTTDPVAAIKEWGGTDVAVVLAVAPTVFRQAFESLNRGGRLVLVSLPAEGVLEIPIFDTVLKGISVIGSIVDNLIGNRYAVGDRQAIRQCAWAAVQRAQQYGGGGYGERYRDRLRVTSINDVQRRTLVLRVRGTLGRGGGYGNGGYNGGYNNGYGGGGYGGGYARPELSFRCDVNYNGYVQDVRIERLGRY